MGSCRADSEKNDSICGRNPCLRQFGAAGAGIPLSRYPQPLCRRGGAWRLPPGQFRLSGTQCRLPFRRDHGLLPSERGQRGKGRARKNRCDPPAGVHSFFYTMYILRGGHPAFRKQDRGRMAGRYPVRQGVPVRSIMPHADRCGEYLQVPVYRPGTNAVYRLFRGRRTTDPDFISRYPVI